MSSSGKVVLRRTWPQRVVMVMCLGVIGAALAAAWFIDDIYVSVASIGRVEISREILLTDTPPGEPINFLLIGTDSAIGIDPDDPIHNDPKYDSRDTFNADSITILRVDPTSGQAWVVSIPRDLLTDDIPGASTNRINAALLIGGPETLVETVTTAFGIAINHYVEIDFLGFRQVVNELSGVPVWFDYPARDDGSGLSIPIAGCHNLDGVEALAYVRARGYEEFIDGRWVRVGNSDFGRIQRQQDFLILALDRAIVRGARNLGQLTSLIEAGAGSVVLDTELTPAELVDLGEAFSEFNPENLDRFSLEVATIFDEERYVGEQLVPEVNEEIFDIFRGAADLVRPSDVRFDLYAMTEATLVNDGQILVGLGFDVADEKLFEADQDISIVVYPPGSHAEAETIARYLIPIPALAVDADATGLTVVLGEDHEQISFFSPHPAAKMRAEVAAHGVVGLPDLSATTAPETSSTTTAQPTTAQPTTDAAVTTTIVPVVTEPARITGRPPEDQSCG